MDEVINKQEILNIAVSAIKDKIGERFSNTYNSPLNKIADEVIIENGDKIKAIFEDCLESTIKSSDFKQAIKDEFAHKVAKTMVGKLVGSIEKAVDKLSQDPTLKARMIIAIEKLVKE